jgi:hypothetical protein
MAHRRARQLLRRRRCLARVEGEHTEPHAEPAELDDDVLALAEFGDAGLPSRERFLPLVRIRADAERSADMVQDGIVTATVSSTH